MRYVNIVWPDEEYSEYSRLFRQYSRAASEAELEDDNLFEKGLNEYINEHASHDLLEWLGYLDSLEKQPV